MKYLYALCRAIPHAIIGFTVAISGLSIYIGMPLATVLSIITTFTIQKLFKNDKTIH